MNSLKKILSFCFYAILIILGVTFAVSNRSRIDLNFFPFVLSVPLFLFAIVVFALGSLLGWSIARVGHFGKHRAHKEANKRIAALENELAAHRSEQLLRKPTAPLLK